MTILILEDNVEFRKPAFIDALSDFELHIFNDVAPAIEYIKTYGMTDIMLLDHDLGGEVYVSSSNENTGYQFALFLEQNKLHCSQIIIHSQNDVGAKNMYVALQNCADEVLQIQFPNLIKELYKRKQDGTRSK